jgi:hypothetical protein
VQRFTTYALLRTGIGLGFFPLDGTVSSSASYDKLIGDTETYDGKDPATGL